MDRSGRILAAETREATPAAPALERCVVERARSWKLAPHDEPRGTWLRYPLILKPPEAARSASPVDADSGSGEGLSKEYLGQAIKSRWHEIQACYDVEMAFEPERFEVAFLKEDFVIGQDGRVLSVTHRESSDPGSSLERCVGARIAAWRFSPPKGGGSVGVTYPWVFVTTDVKDAFDRLRAELAAAKGRDVGFPEAAREWRSRRDGRRTDP